MPLTDLQCPDCGGTLHTDDLLEAQCVTPDCGHKFNREFYEENNVSKAYWPKEMFRDKRKEIAQALRDGERDPAEDADKTNHNPPERLHFIHLGRDGSITVSYSLKSAAESIVAGGVYEFDLMEDYDE